MLHWIKACNRLGNSRTFRANHLIYIFILCPIGRHMIWCDVIKRYMFFYLQYKRIMYELFNFWIISSTFSNSSGVETRWQIMGVCTSWEVGRIVAPLVWGHKDFCRPLEYIQHISNSYCYWKCYKFWLAFQFHMYLIKSVLKRLWPIYKMLESLRSMATICTIHTLIFEPFSLEVSNRGLTGY